MAELLDPRLSIRLFCVPNLQTINSAPPTQAHIQPLQRIPESWNMALGGLVLASLMLYLKGMRMIMFQLSGFDYEP